MKNFIKLLFLILVIPALGNEPKLDCRQDIGTSDWSWMIDRKNQDILNVYQGKSTAPNAQYDLANCMFCTGEEDGCEQDGIFALSLEPDLDKPILVAVCHIGAHSRELQIFTPDMDSEEAVFVATGDYTIDYQIESKGIKVTVDRRNDEGEFEQIESTWPMLEEYKKEEND